MAGQHTECVSFESWNRARKMNSCCWTSGFCCHKAWYFSYYCHLALRG
jgi:hypothetical protein